MRLRKSGATLVKGCSTPFPHVAMDQGSRIIRRVAFTPANVKKQDPDSRCVDLR
jgi:hypothetical protein